MKQFQILNARLNKLNKELSSTKDKVVAAALKARRNIIENQIRMCKAVNKITEPA